MFRKKKSAEKKMEPKLLEYKDIEVNQDLSTVWKEIQQKLNAFGDFTTKVNVYFTEITYVNRLKDYKECLKCKITFSNTEDYCKFCEFSLSNVNYFLLKKK